MSKKPCFKYHFQNVQGAEDFLRYATEQIACSYAQHPLNNGIRDKYRVLVTGSGSMNYDMYLQSSLDKMATVCGGIRE